MSEHISATLLDEQVRHAELQAKALAAILKRFAADLGHDLSDPEVQRLVRLAISQETGVGPAVLEGQTT